MKIVMKRTADLLPYARNPRKNNAAVNGLAASISEFGFKQPIVIDRDSVIVAGHTRLKAAQKLGIETVPCIIADDLTPEQIKAYRILDNKLAEKAEWEPELLQLELSEITLDLEPFEVDFGEDLPFDSTPVDDDGVPDIQADIVSRLGDTWHLGEHRVRCGDSTNPEHVALLLDSHVPFLMVTDPPYGVDYDPEWRLESGLNKEHQTRAEGRVANDTQVDWTEAYKLFPGTVAYVWHAGRHAAEIVIGLHAAGFNIRTQIVWAKPSLVIGRGHYHWQHEPCWYAVRKGGGSAKWCGDRKQSTVWSIANMHRTQGNVDDGKTEHSTQKPVECMARPIRNHGDPTDAVYDPFLGSGTTLIACEKLGRHCFGMELEPKYVDLIVRRWQKLTGKDAILESTGERFNDRETANTSTPTQEARNAP